jgi:hypothetical protein
LRVNTFLRRSFVVDSGEVIRDGGTFPTGTFLLGVFKERRLHSYVHTNELISYKILARKLNVKKPLWKHKCG